MAKRKKLDPELPLFDLPLHPEADQAAAKTDTGGAKAGGTKAGATSKRTAARSPTARSRAAESTSAKSLAAETAVESPPPARLFDTAEEAVEEEVAVAATAEDTAAPIVERLRAGLADLAVQVLMVAVAVTAAYRLGVRVTWAYWPPFTVLTLVFSFLYWVIPLAFWGQTPGMAWVGHLARSLDDEPLTFYQAFLRWLGALFTLGLAALPILLALGGHSLSDRLSRSKTVSV